MTGWQTINGKEYYFDENGVLYNKSRILNLNGTLYYINPDGDLRTTPGWIQNGSDWYYITSNKTVYNKGWLQVNKHWYYLNSDGKMLTGTITV